LLFVALFLGHFGQFDLFDRYSVYFSVLYDPFGQFNEVSSSEGTASTYTRWLECVQVNKDAEPEVFAAFSPRFERSGLSQESVFPSTWKKPAKAALRSHYSLRFYSWAKKYVEDGAKTISLEELRRVFGLESIEDADGNVIKEAPLPVWASFQQRAFDVAIQKGERTARLRRELGCCCDKKRDALAPTI
jgi:hypothetical protein